MIYKDLEIEGSERKLKKVIDYFEKNNIFDIDDIEEIKNSNLLTFKFWNETGIDIESLEITEYDSYAAFEKSIKKLKGAREPEIEVIDVNPIGFFILKTVMTIVFSLAFIGYLFTFFTSIIVRIIY